MKQVDLNLIYSSILTLLIPPLLSPLNAQTIYETDSDDNDGANNIAWDDTATIWDSPFGTPAANAPGSNQTGGLATDSVIFGSHRSATATQNYRIINRNNGTVSNLTIGSANSDFSRQLTLQVRGNNGRLQVDGLTTLGAVVGGTTNQYGQVLVNQNNTTAFLDLRGEVTSGSDHNDNAVVVNAVGSTINLAGNITKGAGHQGLDLRLVRGNLRMDTTGDGNTDTGAQTFDLDDLYVGDTTGNNINGVFELGVGKTFLVGDDIRVARNATATGNTNESTLNIYGATVTVGDDVRIGEVTANDQSGSKTIGTLNVGSPAGGGLGGTLTVTDDINIGFQDAPDATASAGDAQGTLTVNDGAMVSAQNVTVGITAGARGTVSVNNGTLTSQNRFALGGDASNGNDDGSEGTLNVGANGIVNIGIGATSTQHLDVGRDGSGVLNVDGGTVNIGRGNLNIGQSSTETSANNSRGTVRFEGGAQINIGDVYSGAGSNDDGQNSSLNFNKGGGDVVHTGAGTTVRVEYNLHMQNPNLTAGEGATNSDSSYTIDNGLLEIGRNLAPRNNQTGQNTFTVIGDAATITIGRDLAVAQSSFTLAFDFQGGSSISDIDIVRQGNVDGATLDLINTSGLATYSGDILLLDIGASQSGEFAGLPEGTQVPGTAYQITYQAAGTTGMNSVGLVAAIPEPSSLALFGLAGAVLVAYGRRIQR
jgi:hypothetical protein